MPPLDWTQIAVAVISCVLTYLYNKKAAAPTTPTSPTPDPVASHPVIQGILSTLARLATNTVLAPQPSQAVNLPNVLNSILAKPLTISVDGQIFTIDQNGFHVVNPSPPASGVVPTIPVPSKN
jgi:hypothetical protein